MDIERSLLGNPWALWQLREECFNFLFLVLCKGEESTHSPASLCWNDLTFESSSSLSCPAASWLRFFNLYWLLFHLSRWTLISAPLADLLSRLRRAKRGGGGTQMRSLKIRTSIEIIDFSILFGKKNLKKNKKGGFLKNLFPFLPLSAPVGKQKGMTLISLGVSMSSWVHEKVTEMMTPKPESVTVYEDLPTKVWLNLLYLS